MYTIDQRHYPHFDKISGFQTHSILCVPLQVKRQSIGAISALNKLGSQFDEEDSRLLASLAAPAATAIENARLYERARIEITERQRAEIALEQERSLLAKRVDERTAELQLQYQRQRALATIKPVTNHRDELENVLQQIVSATETALPADGGAILILWDEKKEIFYISTVSSKVPNKEFLSRSCLNEEIAQQVFNSQKILVVSDISEIPFGISDWLRNSGLSGFVGVPLLGQGECQGIIYALNCNKREHTKEELDFLLALANRAAIVIANVQLYETLRQTNSELARAVRMKDEFLASMSHELRTPLNSILGVAEGLQEQYYGLLNERQLKSAQVIEESGRHLLALINDILDVAKAESGELTLNISPIPVKKICESSLQFINRSAVKKQISVELFIDDLVEVINGDPRRLKQILINLLSNAVKFTPEGGSIGLNVKGNVTTGLVKITVWDTGIGIATKDIPQLFKPFVQLDSSLSRRFTGTGLGLALVKRLTEMHGGEVIVESGVGQGSRFILTFPWQLKNRLLADSQMQQTTITSLDSLETIHSYHPYRPLVLLVDDDKNNIEIFSELLTLKGFRVNVALNGKESLNLIQAEKPDLILMDIQMPEMDGLETIRRIRAKPEGLGIPIIALTALVMDGDRERCLEAGADEYLSKPVPLQTLVKTVRTFLKIE